jgi:cytochrome b561
MNSKNTVMARYSWAQIILHWLVVVLVVLQYATSGAILRTHSVSISGLAPSRSDLFWHVVHNRAGLLIFLVLCIRIALRLWQGVPAPTSTTTAFQQKFAQFVHAGLYLVLGLQAFTGAVATYFWWPISVAHVLPFKVFLSLVTLHIAGAIWHQFTLKDGILWRITGLKSLK